MGRIRLKESDYLPLNAHILSATISGKAGKFFVSLSTKQDVNCIAPIPKNERIGIDLGIKEMAIGSDGTAYSNPRSLKKNEKALKRASRKLSKKKKDSNNRKKQKLRVQRIHYRISNIRKDALHKATSKITDENQVIILEDLSVSGMMKNHNLAKAISDVGLYEFRRQIEYKAKRKGRTVIIADRFFPSSKMCSCCGNKKESLLLSERIYHCDNCGITLDRDFNASVNLKNYKNTASSAGIYASGEGSSFDPVTGRISPSMKEELNISLDRKV